VKIVIVDTKTTGLDRTRDEVIEVAAIKVEFPIGDPCEIFYQRFAPSMPVSPEAASVNGYTPETWGKTPSLYGREGRLALSGFVEFVSGARWVGSMPQFDFDMLVRPCSVWGLPDLGKVLASRRLIDVGSLGAMLVLAGIGEKGGLDELCEKLKIPDTNDPMLDDFAKMTGGRIGPHTAMGDALRTLAAFVTLTEVFVPAAWEAFGVPR